MPTFKTRDNAGVTQAALLAAMLSSAAMPLPAACSERAVTHQDLMLWAPAWNSHNIGNVLALFAKDVQIDQPENPKPLDYDGARRFFSMIFKAYPDFHVTVRQAIVDGRWAVSVEQVTGTWRADHSSILRQAAWRQAMEGVSTIRARHGAALRRERQNSARFDLLGSAYRGPATGHNPEIADRARLRIP